MQVKAHLLVPTEAGQKVTSQESYMAPSDDIQNFLTLNLRRPVSDFLHVTPANSLHV